VTLIDELPRRSMVALGCAPCWISMAAQAWCKSWNRKPSSPKASTTGLKTLL